MSTAKENRHPVGMICPVCKTYHDGTACTRREEIEVRLAPVPAQAREEEAQAWELVKSALEDYQLMRDACRGEKALEALAALRSRQSPQASALKEALERCAARVDAWRIRQVGDESLETNPVILRLRARQKESLRAAVMDEPLLAAAPRPSPQVSPADLKHYEHINDIRGYIDTDGIFIYAPQPGEPCPHCGKLLVSVKKSAYDPDWFPYCPACERRADYLYKPQPSPQGEDALRALAIELVGEPPYPDGWVEDAMLKIKKYTEARLASAQSSAQGEEARLRKALEKIRDETLGDGFRLPNDRAANIARAALERKEGE